MLLPAVLNAQEAASTWQGTLTSGAEQRRVVLQMAHKANGSWEPTAYYLEFFPDDIHIDSLAQHGSNLKFSINRGKGVYQGKISTDGSLIEGNWTYDGHPAPLELRLATKETAWHTPFLYQYHIKMSRHPALAGGSENSVLRQARLRLYGAGALAWTGERQCVACHTNGSYMVVRPYSAPQLGQPQKAIRDYFISTLRDSTDRRPGEVRDEAEPTQAVYIAAGLAIWDAHVSIDCRRKREALALMFKLQRERGTGSSRTTIIRRWSRARINWPRLRRGRWAMRRVGWPRSAARRWRQRLSASKACCARAARCRVTTTGRICCGRRPSFRDCWMRARCRSWRQMIFAHQKPDGGWSIRTFAVPEEWGKGNRAEKLRAEPELTNPPSDGHMTGLAIIALRKAGVPASDARIQRGVAWLKANQRSSGQMVDAVA